jgi:hypothetical protein
MATIQQLEAQIARARAEVERLQAESRKFAAERTRLFAEQAVLDRELAQQRRIIQDPNATQAQKDAALDRAIAIENQDRAVGQQISQSSRDEQQFIESQINPAVRRLQDLEQQLRIAQQQAATQTRANDDAGTPTVNAGAVVANAQTARDDDANWRLPGETPLPPLASTNAEPTPVGRGDENTDPQPPVPLTKTQGTNPNQPPGEGRLLPDPGSGVSRIEVLEDTSERLKIDVGLNLGTGAASDDQRSGNSPTEQTNITRTRLDALYGSPITTQDNILDNFASYTYSLSWYLVDPEAYRRLIAQQKKSLNGFYLLVQSAGIGQGASQTPTENQQLSLNQQSPEVNALAGGRSQFFPFDYYIDNFETEVLYSAGTASQSAAAFKNVSFTLTEPNGLTLLPNLYRACENLITAGGQLYATDDKINYAAALFCMVIRFYGYDDNGVLQAPITNVAGNTDSRAVIEKFIPFTLKKIDFSVGSRMVEYTIEGAAPEVRTGLSTNRGSIPQDFSFSGVTVQDILVGTKPVPGTGANAGDGRPQTAVPEAQATPAAAAKADSAPKPTTDTVATGLVAALANFQKQLLKDEKIEIEDVYEIKFADTIISDAKMAPPGGLNKNLVGGTPASTAAEKKLPEKSSMSSAVRSKSVRVGTQIIQFIDEVVRSSSYVIDQQAVIYDEKTKTYKQNGKPAQQFAWFNIGVTAEPLGYDRKRKDYAYKITYFVTPYQVPMVSEYFAPGGFRGVHKLYNYWFTGQNTQVLQFEQSFDKLWTQALTADTNLLDLVQQQKQQMNSREQWMRHNYAASGVNRQGGEGKVFEAGANAADFLYGPNYGTIQLSIIGDPAWLPNAQYDYNVDRFSSAPFWPDGTINNSASIPYFEFAWNRPVDYNLGTGLMDPGQKNYFANRDKGEAGLAAESQTYIAVRTKSMFKGGRFSQELEGAWMWDQTINEPKNERETDPRADPRAGRGTNRVEGANILPTPRVAGDGSSTARGVQQLLNPPTQSLNPTLAQLESSQAYITARQAGIPAPEALEIARQRFAQGRAREPVAVQQIVREP